MKDIKSGMFSYIGQQLGKIAWIVITLVILGLLGNILS